MITIYKYPLNIEDTQEIELHEGSKILCVQSQTGVPTLWAVVDTEKVKVKRTIHMYGTGHEIRHKPHTADYIGTFQLMGGTLVYHVFGEGFEYERKV